MGQSNAIQVLCFWRVWRRVCASLLLLLVVTMRLGNQAEGWEWLMADTHVPFPICPGRCLQVNDSKTPNFYLGQVVGFAACQTTSDNQKWVRQQLNGGQSGPITIVEPNTQETRCLEPLWYTDPSSFSIVVVACTDLPRQNWVVDVAQAVVMTDQNIGPVPEPLYLTFNLSKVLQDDDPNRPWYNAFLASSNDTRFYSQPTPNQSKVVSVVPEVSNINGSSFSSQMYEGSSTGNLIRNGGFELSSYLDSSPTDFSVLVRGDDNDVFGICYWTVVQGAVQIYSPQSSANVDEGSLCVLLNGQGATGTVSQVVTTKPGSSYMMVFSMAAQKQCPNTSLATVQVLVSPSSSEFTNFSIQGSGETQGDDLYWQTQSVSFQALTEATNISFQSLTAPGAGCGPSIDNVQVDVLGPEALPPGVFPLPASPLELVLPPQPGIFQEKHHKKFPSVTLSRGAISGIVLGAAALAFGVGSLAFLFIMPFSNRLSSRKSSEQMLPKADNQWGSPSSQSSSGSMQSVPLHELE